MRPLGLEGRSFLLVAVGIIAEGSDALEALMSCRSDRNTMDQRKTHRLAALASFSS